MTATEIALSPILVLFLSIGLGAQSAETKRLAAEAAQFRSLMRNSPRLELKLTEFAIAAPSPGWKIEMASSVAVDREGLIFVLQRGPDADPVIVLNRQGQVLRSWGKGLYKIPHSIRIDRDGNVWTVDAGNSMIHKFSPHGKHLFEINAGLPSAPRSEFCGTTDIAFIRDRIFVSDGYQNARVLEYSSTGKKLREWGSVGDKPGQFHVPHGITIDPEGILYVADRENGRIQRFTLEGRYLGEWHDLGKTFSLQVGQGNDLWLGTQPRDVANGSEPWLVKVNRSTGKILGVVESRGHHSIDLNAEGEPLTGARPDKVLWFRKTLR